MVEPIHTFELPWPPSVNAYWRRRGSNYFIDTPGKAFRSNVQAAVIGTLRRMPKALLGLLAVEIDLHPPDGRHGDVDNYSKGVLDGLAHAGIIQDDKQFRRQTVEMFEPSKPGKAVVRIYEYRPLADFIEGG